MIMIRKVLDKIFNTKEGRNASWIIAGRIAQMVLGLIVSILSARYLGPNNYGLINYAAAYAGFFASLCTLGINSVIIKYFSDYPDDEGRIIGTTLFLRVISSILSVIFISLIVNTIDKNEQVTLIVCILFSLSLVFQVGDTFNYWFQSKYNSKASTISSLIAYVVISIYKIIILMLNKDVYWFAFSSALNTLLVSVFLYISYIINNGPKLSINMHLGKKLLGTSYHYILSGMMVAIYGQTDKLMLKQMLDESMVGYYSLASNLNTMWVFVLSAIITSLTPTIIKQHNVDYERYIKKNKQLYAIVIYICLFVSVCIVIFGRFAIKILYGEAYLPTYLPLIIISGYTMFSYLGVARDSWVICENKQKYLKYMYFVAAGLNIVLNILLIPKFGATGAATASLFTQIGTCIVIPLFIKEMRPNVMMMFDSLLLKGVIDKKNEK